MHQANLLLHRLYLVAPLCPQDLNTSTLASDPLVMQNVLSYLTTSTL